MEFSYNGSSWEELQQLQGGAVQSYVSGTTANYGRFPGPGGGTIVTGGNVTLYWAHKDWIGNARITSNINTNAWFADKAYTPFGEIYSAFGSAVTQQTDFFAGTSSAFNPLGVTMWDTPNRELSIVGRWLSPDPAGYGWNQYAYVTNPNSLNDPLGLSPGGPNGPACLARGRGAQAAASGGCYPDPFGGGGSDGGSGGPDPTLFGNLIYDLPGYQNPGAEALAVYLSCVSYGFQCDADGNYKPPAGAYVITVACGGTFSVISCAPPPQALNGSSPVGIYTSLGMQYGLSLLAQYQADPMSSSGKDILQQLSQMSSSAQAFIIAGYAGSVLGGVGDAVATDLAVGPQQSVLFGRFNTQAGGGFSGYLNAGSPIADWLRIGFGWNDITGQTVFRISVGDGIHLLEIPWSW